jgi:type VI secretion system secreted protein VgrG
LATYTQTERALRLTTPLGPDALLVTQLSGRESLSQLYGYELTLLAPADEPADFSKLLGQPVCVELDSDKKTRYFHGIVSKFSQGRRDETFIHYRMEILPQFWLLTRNVQSRIFQQMSIPDILKKVLKGLTVKWDIQGHFDNRDYCVQYRESDFAFASRLMEEEGIYYYFVQEKSGATMVVANTPVGHADVPIAKKIIFEEIRGGNRPETRIFDWVKTQELRSGKVTLWDHCFELPHKHLEASKTVPDSVTVGKVTHKLKVAGNDKLELYDYPGMYARRFDGIDPGGGDRAGDLGKIFTDNARTTEIRLQEEQAVAILIQGQANAPQLTAGHKFTLDRHPDADGDYVVTEVTHSARMAVDYRSGSVDKVEYSSQFSCMPAAIPYRPARETPWPRISGTQTAVVVGPGGEEIYTDKYGRVKVQFHWDRQGKNDENSSCWIRVATIWAGKAWGVIHIPRIGQEVVVAFEEGDPDQPLIVGSVYNADQMPPWQLPANKMCSGSRTASTPGSAGFNGTIANDTKGTELLDTHAQFNMKTVVEHDQTTTVHNNRTDVIDVDDSETVGGNQHQHVVKDQTVNIDANRTETVGKNEKITVSGNRSRSVSGHESVTVTMTRTHTVGINEAITVGAAREVTVGGLQTITVGAYQAITVAGYQKLSVGATHTITVGGAQQISVGAAQKVSVAGNEDYSIGGKQSVSIGGDCGEKIGGKLGVDVSGEVEMKSGKKIEINAADEISLVVGSASLLMKKDGTIVLKGKDIGVEGSGKIEVKADAKLNLKGSEVHAN